MKASLKQKYISSAFLLMVSTAIVKAVSAVYKIPLTAYIGAVGRGYFSTAYNLCLPIHALTMGAFPIALTKLIGMYEAKGDLHKIKALRKASKKLFFLVGAIGLLIMLIFSKPYSSLVTASPKGAYTTIALAPSIFFSCLCACDRAFCEGFLDMKCTAISQIIEALTKMIFGLLMSKTVMSLLINEYTLNSTVLGISAANEEQALAIIYPITSAVAMLGVTLGAVFSCAFAGIYTRINHNHFVKGNIDAKEAFNEIVLFSVSIVGATAVQGIANFGDNFSIQYCLANYNQNVLAELFNTSVTDASTYVYGIYSTALDFKNLVPSLVMTLGITAVPAVSSAFETDGERFSQLLTSIFRYSSILSAVGGAFLAIFGDDLLTILYSENSPDIIENSSRLLFLFGVTMMPCCIASTSVFCTQALGYSRLTILPFAVSAVVRIVMNFILIPINRVNICAVAFSSFAGYLLIMVWTMVLIRKKSNCKLSVYQIFIKPIFVTTIAYFFTTATKETITVCLSSNVSLIINVFMFIMSEMALLFLFGCLSLRELKLFK